MSVTISGSGQIIKQVVQTAKTSVFTASGSGSFLDITGLSVSITPTNASNRIFVQVSLGGTASGNDYGFRLVRDSTAICVGDAAGTRTQTTTGNGTQTGGTNGNMSANMMFLDSPSTTSAVTYKVQAWVTSGQTLYINQQGNDSDLVYRLRSASTITVMEVAYA